MLLFIKIKLQSQKKMLKHLLIPSLYIKKYFQEVNLFVADPHHPPKKMLKNRSVISASFSTTLFWAGKGDGGILLGLCCSHSPKGRNLRTVTTIFARDCNSPSLNFKQYGRNMVGPNDVKLAWCHSTAFLQNGENQYNLGWNRSKFITKAPSQRI